MNDRLDPRDPRPQMKHGRLIPRLTEIVERVNKRLALIPLDLEPQGDLEKASPPRPPRGHRGLPRSSKRWSAFQAIVQKMTNHQRNQWARAGYPGLRHKDPKPVRRFCGIGSPSQDTAQPEPGERGQE